MNLSNDERRFIQRGCRTKNRSEQKVISDLEQQGYTVIKRGWPDLVAFKDDETRFIEVKPPTTAKMKAQQLLMSKLLARHGITVELIRA